jgi:hypothetical protein
MQRCVETKESQGNFQPSLPQAYFGEQVSGLKIPKTVAAALSVVIFPSSEYLPKR